MRHICCTPVRLGLASLALAAFSAALAAQSSPLQGQAIVLDKESNEVRRVDLATGATTKLQEGIAGLWRLDVNRSESTVYVVEQRTLELSAIDVATGEVRMVTSFRAAGYWSVDRLVLGPSHGQQEPGFAYALSRGGTGGSLVRVDVVSGAITTITSDAWLSGLDLDEDGTTAYTSSPNGIVAIDLTTTPATRTIVSPWQAMNLALDELHQRIILAGTLSDLSLLAIDLATGDILSATQVLNYRSDWETVSLDVSADGSSLVALNGRISNTGYGIEVIEYDLTDLPPLPSQNANDWTDEWSEVRHFALPAFVNPTELRVGRDSRELYLADAAECVERLSPDGAVLEPVPVRLGFPLDVDQPAGSTTAYVLDAAGVRPSQGPLGHGLGYRISTLDPRSGELTSILEWTRDPGATEYLVEGEFEASPDGSCFYLVRHSPTGESLVSVDLNGAISTGIPVFPSQGRFPFELSADGTTVFTLNYSGGGNNPSPAPELRAYDLATGSYEVLSTLFVGVTGQFYVRRMVLAPDDSTIWFAASYYDFSQFRGALIQVDLSTGNSLDTGYDVRSPANLSSFAVDLAGRTVDEVFIANEETLTWNGSHYSIIHQLTAIDPATGAATPISTVPSSGFVVLFNTAIGPVVTSSPLDPTTGTQPAAITFSTVVSPGDTTLTTSTTGPAVPAGFQLGGAGVYYEIHTTAQFNGTVELRIDYTGTTFTDESTLQLLHYENNKWVNVTTTRDPDNNRIYGVVKSFSPFVVAEFPAMTALDDLVVRVHNLDVKHGIVVSLDAKLDAAMQALDHALAGQRSSAVSCMNAFVSEVRAQNVKLLPADVAAGLIADANAIIALLGG